MSLKVTLEHWARCTRTLLQRNACGKVGHCTTPSYCSLKHFLLNHLAHDLLIFCTKNFFFNQQWFRHTFRHKIFAWQCSWEKKCMAIFHPFYSLIFEKIKAAVGFQKLLCSLIIFTHRCAQLVVNEVEGKEKVFCSFFFFHGFCKSGLYSREGLQFLIL